MIPDIEQRATDGKNRVGITMASNMPNLLRASSTEFPNCLSVTGIRASLALLRAEVSTEPAIMGRANFTYEENPIEAFP